MPAVTGDVKAATSAMSLPPAGGGGSIRRVDISNQPVLPPLPPPPPLPPASSPAASSEHSGTPASSDATTPAAAAAGAGAAPGAPAPHERDASTLFLEGLHPVASAKIVLILLFMWIVGQFGGSIWWVAIVAWIWLYSRYRTKVWAIRSTRAVSQRELLVHADPQFLRRVLGAHLPAWCSFPESERVDWLNRIIAGCWTSVTDALELSLMATLNPLLVTYTPSFLKSLAFSRIDMGTLSPLITGVRVITHPNNMTPSSGGGNVPALPTTQIMVDIDILWHGNPDVVLDVALPVGGVMRIKLEHIQFDCQLRVVLAPLVPQFPCFGAIAISFLKKPKIDFTLNALHVNLMHVPGLKSTINDLLKNSLASLMVWPKKMVFPLMKVSNALLERMTGSTKEPSGLLKVHIKTARHLGSTSLFGRPNPFCILNVAESVAKQTRVIKNALHPEWNESFDFLVDDTATEQLRIRLEDKALFGSNNFLGSISLPLSSIVNDDQSPVELDIPIEFGPKSASAASGSGSIQLIVQFQTFDRSADDDGNDANDVATADGDHKSPPANGAADKSPAAASNLPLSGSGGSGERSPVIGSASHQAAKVAGVSAQLSSMAAIGNEYIRTQNQSALKSLAEGIETSEPIAAGSKASGKGGAPPPPEPQKLSPQLTPSNLSAASASAPPQTEEQLQQARTDRMVLAAASLISSPTDVSAMIASLTTGIMSVTGDAISATAEKAASTAAAANTPAITKKEQARADQISRIVQNASQSAREVMLRNATPNKPHAVKAQSSAGPATSSSKPPLLSHGSSEVLRPAAISTAPTATSASPVASPNPVSASAGSGTGSGASAKGHHRSSSWTLPAPDGKSGSLEPLSPAVLSGLGSGSGRNASGSTASKSYGAGILLVNIRSGSDLVAMDSGGKSDPYCLLTLGNSTVRTKTIPNTLNPTWDQQFDLTVTDASKQSLKITVMDADLIGADEFMGSLEISVLDIARSGRVSQSWPLQEVKSGKLAITLVFKALSK